jgi:hypothetical protein
MPRGITLQEASARLQEAGVANADRYQRGTSGKGAKWHQATTAAEANYQEGIQRALSEKRFGKGVQAAGASSYDAGVSAKGVANWPTGMRLAGPKYEKKVQKFVALWNAPLSTPKGSRRSPANLKRMTENVERFIKAA